MSPARAGDGVDLERIVRQVVLDVTLLKWFATSGGRGAAVASAIASARRQGRSHEAPIFDFLERHVGGER